MCTLHHDIVVRYHHRPARSVNRPSRATHSDIRSLTRIPSENIGCESEEGERDRRVTTKEREREKERNEGRVGLLARDESARARGQDKTSDHTSFELVGISLRLDESERASERASTVLSRAMVSYYVSRR